MRGGYAVWLIVLWIAVTDVDARSKFVSESVYRSVTEADQLIAKNRETEALGKLQRLLKRNTLKDYERSVIYRVIGIIYTNLGKDVEATDYFERVLRDAQLSETLLRRTRHHLAHVYVQQENYAAVLTLLSPVIQSQQEPTAQESFFLAFAYFELEQTEQSLLWAERALKLMNEMKPPEHYLSLAINSNLTHKHYSRAAELLDRVVYHYPNRSGYWRQLVAVRLELDDEARALAAMELGYLQGVLVETHDLKRLANLYLQQNLPYQSARIFQKLLRGGNDEDYRLHEWLAMALRQAREYASAIPYLVKAAEISGDGKLFLYLAHLYAEQEDWTAALQAVSQAIDKNNLPNSADARLLQGIIQVQLNQFDSAEQNFLYCLGFDKNRKQALRWLESLSNMRASRSQWTDSQRGRSNTTLKPRIGER